MLSPGHALAPSLAARRALSENASGLDRSLRRLSSGLRVAGARDDAAGLAIAERMTARLRGTDQALRNTNDAIALFQTADGALGQITERLQRTRELLVQALNGAGGIGDLASIDAEVQLCLGELDRQAAAARFNGHALLDGHLGPVCFQVGAGGDDGLVVALDQSARRADLGAIATAASSDLRTAGNRDGGLVFAATYTTVPISTFDFSRPTTHFAGGSTRTAGTPPTNYAGANGAQVSVDGLIVTLDADYGSLGGLAAAMQSQLGTAAPGAYGVSANGSSITITKTAAAAAATTAPQLAGAGGNSAAWNGGTTTAGTPAATTTNAGFSVDGRRVSITADYGGDLGGLIADIQAQLDARGLGAYRVSGSSGGISITRIGGLHPPVVGSFSGIGASVFAGVPQTGLTLAEGELFVQVGARAPVAVTGRFMTPEALAAGVAARVGGVAATVNARTGALEISSGQTITLSGSAADAGGALAFGTLVNETGGSLLAVDASDADAARKSLLRIDTAIDQVGAQRSRFGALQGRFEAMLSQLELDRGVLAGARGRIVDADMAAESAQLARHQVLQQAAQALLAQANAHAGDVLKLLS